MMTFDCNLQAFRHLIFTVATFIACTPFGEITKHDINKNSSIKETTMTFNSDLQISRQ